MMYNNTFFDDLQSKMEGFLVKDSVCGRIEIEILPVDLFHLLEYISTPEKIFWKSKHNNNLYIAFSSAYFGYYSTTNIFIQKWLEKKARGYLFFSFDLKKKIQLHKKKIKSKSIWIPAVEFYTNNNLYYCAVNYTSLENFYTIFNLLKNKYKPSIPILKNILEKEQYFPHYKQWTKNIKKVKSLFAKTKLIKLVLSRILYLKFKYKVQILNLFIHFAKDIQNVYICYFQFSKTATFLSFTPETLFKRDGNSIFCEAIAGTRSRGLSTKDDQELLFDLEQSTKDILEHNVVENEINHNLKKVCVILEKSTRTTLKLNYVQHLYSSFFGTLKDKIDDLSIIQLLHPTPAVGGYPKKFANKYIEKIEGFDRGLYATPIGFISKDTTDMAVGIRSVFICSNQAYIYSGAGIMQDSDTEKEWVELNHKISLIKKMLYP